MITTFKESASSLQLVTFWREPWPTTSLKATCPQRSRDAFAPCTGTRRRRSSRQRGHQFEEMSVGVVEVDTAAAEPAVNLTGLAPHRVGEDGGAQLP